MEESAQLDLARRYRPMNLDGYIGNDRMVSTIRRSFDDQKQEQYPRKLLIEGKTGCGKTTMARILIRYYLCESPVDGRPCDQCEMCQLTAEYVRTGNTDSLAGYLQEVNVGDVRRVDDLEEIMDTFDYLPAGLAKFSCYVFDEMQASSKTAQESLLKKIEDLPSHVVVMFCTTNKESLNDTLINRCNLDLTVRKPPMADLAGLLQSICQQEGFRYEKAGLRDICIYSGNVIRQTLQNLERVLVTHRKEGATEAAVQEELNVVSEADIIDFFTYLVDESFSQYIALINSISMNGNIPQFVSYAQQVLARGILVSHGITEVEGLTTDEIKMYRRLFKGFSNSELVSIAAALKNVRSSDDYGFVIDLISLAYTYRSPRYDVDTNVADAGTAGSAGAVDRSNREINEADIHQATNLRLQEEAEQTTADALLESQSEVSIEDILSW